jgi:hypothetical protein
MLLRRAPGDVCYLGVLAGGEGAGVVAHWNADIGIPFSLRKEFPA